MKIQTFLTVGAKFNEQITKAKANVRNAYELKKDAGLPVSEADLEKQLAAAETMVWNEWKKCCRISLKKNRSSNKAFMDACRLLGSKQPLSPYESGH